MPENGERPDMGSFKVPIQPPEVAGEISVREVTELRARNDQLEWLQKKVEDLQHFQTVFQIVSAEKLGWIQALCRSKGLNPDEAEYSLDSAQGLIFKTAYLKPANDLTPVAAGPAALEAAEQPEPLHAVPHEPSKDELADDKPEE